MTTATKTDVIDAEAVGRRLVEWRGGAHGRACQDRKGDTHHAVVYRGSVIDSNASRTTQYSNFSQIFTGRKRA